MSGAPQMRNRSARAGRHRQARTAGERSAEHFGGTAAARNGGGIRVREARLCCDAAAPAPRLRPLSARCQARTGLQGRGGAGGGDARLLGLAGAPGARVRTQDRAAHRRGSVRMRAARWPWAARAHTYRPKKAAMSSSSEASAAAPPSPAVDGAESAMVRVFRIRG